MKKIELFLQEWLVTILLVMMVIAAFLAYGSPLPVIQLLLAGDEIAIRGVKVIFGWLIAGFVIVFIYNWLYDFFTAQGNKSMADKIDINAAPDPGSAGSPAARKAQKK